MMMVKGNDRGMGKPPTSERTSKTRRAPHAQGRGHPPLRAERRGRLEPNRERAEQGTTEPCYTHSYSLREHRILALAQRSVSAHGARSASSYCRNPPIGQCCQAVVHASEGYSLSLMIRMLHLVWPAICSREFDPTLVPVYHHGWRLLV